MVGQGRGDLLHLLLGAGHQLAHRLCLCEMLQLAAFLLVGLEGGVLQQPVPGRLAGLPVDVLLAPARGGPGERGNARGQGAPLEVGAHGGADECHSSGWCGLVSRK